MYKMEKFNWKEEMKKSMKGLINDMWYLLCLLLTVSFVIFTQTEKQFQSIVAFVVEKDLSMIAVMFIGVVCMSAGLEKLLKGIWWIIKFIDVLVNKKK